MQLLGVSLVFIVLGPLFRPVYVERSLYNLISACAQYNLITTIQYIFPVASICTDCSRELERWQDREWSISCISHSLIPQTEVKLVYVTFGKMGSISLWYYDLTSGWTKKNTHIQEDRRYVVMYQDPILSFEVASKMMNRSRRASPVNSFIYQLNITNKWYQNIHE